MISTNDTAEAVLNRAQVATELGVRPGAIYGAVELQLIRPDFLDGKGAPLFLAARLPEIARALNTPEICA